MGVGNSSRQRHAGGRASGDDQGLRTILWPTTRRLPDGRRVDLSHVLLYEKATAIDPIIRLRQLAAANVRWRLEHPAIAEVFDLEIGASARVNRLPDEHRRRVRAIKRMYIDELRSILKDGRRRGTFHFEDVRVTAFAIVTLCGSAHTWYDPGGDLTVDEVGAMYADYATGLFQAPLRAAAPR